MVPSTAAQNPDSVGVSASSTQEHSFPQLRRKPSGTALNRTPSATHALPISDSESVPVTLTDSDRDAWCAARDKLPQVIRDGLLCWDDLPEVVQVGIEALFRAAR
jgi:hypothetical protein